MLTLEKTLAKSIWKYLWESTGEDIPDISKMDNKIAHIRRLDLQNFVYSLLFMKLLKGG